MSIYINKNNQQSGPYEEHVVIDQLRNGMLSPDDLAIRHGGTSWQRLGDMFPDVRRAASPPIAPVASVPRTAANVSSASGPAAKGGGCAPIAGIILLVFGLLLLLGGTGGAIANRMMQPEVCAIADKYDREVKEAEKALEAAKGTSREAEAQADILDKLESAEIWTRGCSEAKSQMMIFLVACVGVAGFGFLLIIIGFFLRRKRARA